GKLVDLDFFLRKFGVLIAYNVLIGKAIGFFHCQLMRPRNTSIHTSACTGRFVFGIKCCFFIVRVSPVMPTRLLYVLIHRTLDKYNLCVWAPWSTKINRRFRYLRPSRKSTAMKYISIGLIVGCRDRKSVV